jgi:sugar porter (SP) family MFS transporter
MVEATRNVGQDVAIINSEGNSTSFVYLVSIVAALGGLLFGFDTAVINGALVFLKRDFALTDFQTEIAASSILFGCILGASIAGPLTDWLGRKWILASAAALFLLSALGSAIPVNLVQFSSARFFGGIAIGIASMLSPLYIAEIAPARIRGRLVTLNQLAIVTGILCAFIVSRLLANLNEDSWRWMFAAAAIPSLLFMFALFFVPESPRWLIKKGYLDKALDILRKSLGSKNAQLQMEEIKLSLEKEENTKERLWQPRLKIPLIIGISLAILQQITGINTILYYGSIIFTEHASNQTVTNALDANTIVGLINLICTIIALWIIDRVGRKPLLLSASAGMGISLTLLALAFYLQLSSSIILTLILFYVACFAIGVGPGVWLLMSELFPTSVRGRAMSIATICLWSACTLVTFTFLTLVKTVGSYGAFLIYAIFCFATFLLVWLLVPETKGKTLEEIERSWS